MTNDILDEDISTGSRDDPGIKCAKKEKSSGKEQESQAQLSVQEENKSLENPFGSAIGEVKRIIRGCRYDKHRGDLFIATKAVCFRSTNLFGLVENFRLIIPWRTVTDVRKNDEMEDSITIESKKEKVFIFFKVKHIQVDETLKSLLESLKENQSDSNEQPIDESELLNLKQGEEKSKKKGLLMSIQEELDEEYEIDVEQAVKEALIISKSMKKCLENGQNGPIDEGSILSGGKIGETEEDYLAIATIAAMAEFRTVSRVISDRKKALRTLESELKGDKVNKPEETPTNMKIAWQECRNSMLSSFKETAVEETCINCDVPTFFEKFLADDAPHSLGIFQGQIGDTNINISPWRKSEDGISQKRTINYVHPVHAPMAPPQAEASKYQTLRIYGSHGLYLKSKVEVNDVPLTDCFYVEELILVQKNSENGVSVTMKFELRFVKSTIFRRIIENTTRGDVSHAMESLTKYFSSIVEKGKEDSSELTNDTPNGEVKEEPSIPISSSGHTFKIIISLLIIALLFMHSVTFTELQAYKKVANDLEKRLISIESSLILREQVVTEVHNEMPQSETNYSHDAF